jgi:hypothetical protein
MLVNSSYFGLILKLLEGEFSAIIGLNSTNFIPRLWILARSDYVLYLIFPVPFVRADKLLDSYLSVRFGPKEADLSLSIEVIDHKKPISSTGFNSGCELTAAANVDVDEVSSSLRTVENWTSIGLVRRASDSAVSVRLFGDC